MKLRDYGTRLAVSIGLLNLLASGLCDAQVSIAAHVTDTGNSFRYHYTATNTGATPLSSINVVIGGSNEQVDAPPGWIVQKIEPPGQRIIQWVARNAADDIGPGASLSGFTITSATPPGQVEFGAIDETPVIYDSILSQGPAVRASQLSNISTRGLVQTSDNVMIGGFIIQGTGPKTVIVRAIGPELTQYGVSNVLADPTLELHNGAGASIASNDNWQTTHIGGIITAGQVSSIQNSGHAPTQANESAIIATLQPGNYTAIVLGKNNTTGVALVEVYDLSSDAASSLGNISTREFVQTGDNVMIGGFIVQGPGTQKVIIRAIGPELTQYGVPDVLANPTLELHDGTGTLIASNNNWRTTIIGGVITAGQVAAIQASGHAPTDPSESAIIAELPPGNYTAIVRGVNDTTGVGLVEVYDLDR